MVVVVVEVLFVLLFVPAIAAASVAVACRMASVVDGSQWSVMTLHGGAIGRQFGKDPSNPTLHERQASAAL